MKVLTLIFIVILFSGIAYACSPPDDFDDCNSQEINDYFLSGDISRINWDNINVNNLNENSFERILQDASYDSIPMNTFVEILNKVDDVSKVKIENIDFNEVTGNLDSFFRKVLEHDKDPLNLDSILGKIDFSKVNDKDSLMKSIFHFSSVDSLSDDIKITVYSGEFYIKSKSSSVKVSENMNGYSLAQIGDFLKVSDGRGSYLVESGEIEIKNDGIYVRGYKITSNGEHKIKTLGGGFISIDNVYYKLDDTINDINIDGNTISFKGNENYVLSNVNLIGRNSFITIGRNVNINAHVEGGEISFSFGKYELSEMTGKVQFKYDGNKLSLIDDDMVISYDSEFLQPATFRVKGTGDISLGDDWHNFDLTANSYIGKELSIVDPYTASISYLKGETSKLTYSAFDEGIDMTIENGKVNYRGDQYVSSGMATLSYGSHNLDLIEYKGHTKLYDGENLVAIDPIESDSEDMDGKICFTCEDGTIIYKEDIPLINDNWEGKIVINSMEEGNEAEIEVSRNQNEFDVKRTKYKNALPDGETIRDNFQDHGDIVIKSNSDLYELKQIDQEFMNHPLFESNGNKYYIEDNILYKIDGADVWEEVGPVSDAREGYIQKKPYDSTIINREDGFIVYDGIVKIKESERTEQETQEHDVLPEEHINMEDQVTGTTSIEEITPSKETTPSTEETTTGEVTTTTEKITQPEPQAEPAKDWSGNVKIGNIDFEKVELGGKKFLKREYKGKTYYFNDEGIIYQYEDGRLYHTRQGGYISKTYTEYKEDYENIFPKRAEIPFNNNIEPTNFVFQGITKDYHYKQYDINGIKIFVYKNKYYYDIEGNGYDLVNGKLIPNNKHSSVIASLFTSPSP